MYAAGFGLSAIPVAIYLRRHGTLPRFGDMFEMFGGPWSSRVADSTFVILLVAFSLITLVVAWSGWLLWQGSRTGAVLNLALIPIEAIFWFGFALPIPVVLGVVRIALVLVAWKSLEIS
jgi:hypothetical protein